MVAVLIQENSRGMGVGGVGGWKERRAWRGGDSTVLKKKESEWMEGKSTIINM